MSKVVKRASNIQLKTVPPPTEGQNAQLEDSTTPNSSDLGDACIVQCVFKQLGMVSTNKFL